MDRARVAGRGLRGGRVLQSKTLERIRRAVGWWWEGNSRRVANKVELLEERRLLAETVVISEIMHHPVPYDPGAEYIELYNAGAAGVDLGGWRISRGVEYAFAAGTRLEAGQYLVVVADVQRFQQVYPGQNAMVVGGWTGRLSNSQEEIRLDNAAGVRIDSVTYADEGDWAIRRRGAVDHGHSGWEWWQAADGGGHSLELINPILDNDQGQNWASSLGVKGTPGRVNSVASGDIAPMILGVQHAPLVPKSAEAVTVTARLVDEKGTASGATLRWRVDRPSPAAFAAVTMRDDGQGGDALGNDGIWTAVIPAQANQAIVEFYVEATDGGVSRTWPAAGLDAGGNWVQTANALYQVDDAVYAGTQPMYRLIMREMDRVELADIGDSNTDGISEADSNAQMNGTFIGIDGVGSQVRYNVGIRNRGHGSRVGPPNNYRVNIPSDRVWKDVTAVNLNARYTHSQVMGSAIFRLAGLAAGDAAPVQVRVNGLNLATSSYMHGSYVLMEEKNSDFADNHFPDDSNGNLYTAFRMDPNGVPEADLRYEGMDPNAYRNRYFKQSNTEADDWADLIQLVNVLNNAPEAAYFEEVSKVINVEQWMRYLALDSLLLNRETGLHSGIGDDYALYRGMNDTRFVLVPHDLDTLMNQGNSTISTDTSIFTFSEGMSGRGDGVDGLKRLFRDPQVLRIYYQQFLDLINTVFNPQVMNPLIDQMLGGWVAQSNINAMKQYVVDRTAGVLRQIPQALTVSSPLAVVSGYPRTGGLAAPLTGTADVTKTGSLTVNGQLVNWNPRTGTWSIGAMSGTGGTVTLIKAGVQGTQNPNGQPGAAGNTWKYFTGTSGQQGTGWRTLGFDDSPTAGWGEGVAQFGYNDGDENTVLADNGRVTTYFRKQFTVADKSQIERLTLRLLRDDGAVIWLNNNPTPLLSLGMPGTFDHTTYASENRTGTQETTFTSYTIDPNLLVNGENIIAVELHNAYLTSSPSVDTSFDLGLEAVMKGAATGVALSPGINRLVVKAFAGLNGTGAEVGRTYIDVWSEAPGADPAAPPVAVSDLQLLTPATYRAGNPVLIQVAALDASGKVQRDLWDATVTLSVDRSGVTLSTNQITLRNGLGNALVSVTGSGAFELTAKLGEKTVGRWMGDVGGTTMLTVSGPLSGTSTTWSGVVHVTGDVLVPDNHVLTIAPGTLVLIDGVASGDTGVDIDVQGTIRSLGMAQQPVTITAFDPTRPWGEIHHDGAEPSLYQYTLISRAGSSPRGGHANVGPAIRTVGSKITFEHVSITDIAGKSMQASSSDLVFTESVLARSVMGPEIAGTGLLMTDSFIFEMRNADDGDGIYIHSQQAGQIDRIVGGMIGFVDDDGLDTLSSTVTVDGTIIRDTKDKGASIFNGNVTLNHVLVVDCALTPEDGGAAAISAKSNAGSSATVNLDHATIVSASAAIQVRNKDGSQTGRISYVVTNSILWAADPVQVEPTHLVNADFNITYSDLNEPWANLGNISANPVFVSAAGHDFHLRPGSPAINAGNPAAPLDTDGSRNDMGFYGGGTAGAVPPQTIAGGTTLVGNTYLYPDLGPYRITGDVVVPTQSTLWILPGTTLFFDPGASLTINGRLVAEGTEQARIRFARTPGAVSPWEGLQFIDTTQDNRICWAVIEYGGLTTNNGMVGLTNANLVVDHVHFNNSGMSDHRRIRAENSSLVVRNSEFSDFAFTPEDQTPDNVAEHIWGSGIMPGGQVILENNIFGKTKGHNDAIDFDDAGRAGAVIQVLNNVFLGGGDDAMDLEVDSYIEGNRFLNYRKDAQNKAAGNSNGMSAGGGRNYVMVRNVFANVDHVAQVKDGAFLTFVNNTVVGTAFEAIYFRRPDGTGTYGRGASVEGSIFKDIVGLFGTKEAATQLTVNRSIVPAEALSLGAGNTSEDPRLMDLAKLDWRLRAGSPGLGSGPNGADMGAMIAGGATISGEPMQLTGKRGAILSVGGAGITHYKYRVNGGPWSDERTVSTAIELNGLAEGEYTVSVVGKNWAGVWQSAESVSRTWTVRTSSPVVLINELLATNTSAVNVKGRFPDLIELYNPGEEAVSLAGMSISDDPADPTRYVFPAWASIGAGQHLILYADSRSGTGEIHVGFSLKGSGEGVYLYGLAGRQVDGVTFGVQIDNLSIGRLADGQWGLTAPSLGAANTAIRTGDWRTLKINEWLANGAQPHPNDFIELYNPDALPVAVGGLYITDNPANQATKHQLAPLSFVNGRGYLALIADDDEEQGADHVNFKLASEQELIGLFGPDLTRIDMVLYGSQRTGVSQGRRPDGSSTIASFTQPSPGLSNPTGPVASSPLRVTEIMYNPAGDAAYSSSDYEFIELKNIGTTPLNLENMRLAAGIDFVFPAVTLNPGQTIVVVNDRTAFAARYGAGINIAGEFSGTLADGGEQIRLLDAAGSVLQDFSYADVWYPMTDGGGYALAIVDAAADPSVWSNMAAWRASWYAMGSPGMNDPETPVETTIGGQEAAETFHVRRSAEGPVVLITVTSNAGSTEWEMPWYALLRVDALGGDDTLVLDFVNGSPIPAGGIQFTGGLGADQVRLMNLPAGQYLEVGTGVLRLGLQEVTHEAESVVLAGQDPVLGAVSISGAGWLGVAQGAGRLRVDSLAIVDSGVLDLADNELVVRTGTVAQIEAWIAAGRNGGAWNGTGIISSTARDNAIMGLAVAGNNTGNGNKLWTSEDLDAVLVKYTYNGDVNLDGQINLNDYFIIDSGYLNGRMQYQHGDVNFDGEINLSDYFMIDSAYLNQQTPLGGVFNATVKVKRNVAEGKKVMERKGEKVKRRKMVQTRKCRMER